MLGAACVHLHAGLAADGLPKRFPLLCTGLAEAGPEAGGVALALGDVLVAGEIVVVAAETAIAVAAAAEEAAAAVAGVLAPVQDEGQAEEHTAQMRHVCYAVAGMAEGAEKLDDGIADDEPLRLDREGDGDDEHTLLRERHAKAQQDAIDSTRGAHRGPVVQIGVHRDDQPVQVDAVVGVETRIEVFDVLYALLHQARTEAADNIIEEEALRTHHAFHDAPEHPDGKHIEEDMLQTAVDEHIGEELV